MSGLAGYSKARANKAMLMRRQGRHHHLITRKVVMEVAGATKEGLHRMWKIFCQGR